MGRGREARAPFCRAAGCLGVRVWRGGSPWISAGDRGGALRARGRCGRRRKATLTSRPGVSVAERASAVWASSADRWARGRRERGRRAGVSGPKEGSAAGLEQRLAGWRAVRESGPSGGGWPAGRASGGVASWAGARVWVLGWVWFPFSILFLSSFQFLMQTKFEFKYKFEFKPHSIKSMHQHECNTNF